MYLDLHRLFEQSELKFLDLLWKVPEYIETTLHFKFTVDQQEVPYFSFQLKNMYIGTVAAWVSLSVSHFSDLVWKTTFFHFSWKICILALWQPGYLSLSLTSLIWCEKQKKFISAEKYVYWHCGSLGISLCLSLLWSGVKNKKNSFQLKNMYIGTVAAWVSVSHFSDLVWKTTFLQQQKSNKLLSWLCGLVVVCWYFFFRLASPVKLFMSNSCIGPLSGLASLD